MAITKKAKAIQLQKAVLRDSIDEVNALLRQQSDKVPRSVLAGSHQMAVEWKDLAEKCIRISDVGSQKASVMGLEALLRKRQSMLKQLRGEKA